NLLEMRFHVYKRHQGLLALGGGDEVGRVRHRLHAVAKVLQFVDQLAAWEQLLIQQQCQRLFHRTELGTDNMKLQKIFARESLAGRPPFLLKVMISASALALLPFVAPAHGDFHSLIVEADKLIEQAPKN